MSLFKTTLFDSRVTDKGLKLLAAGGGGPAVARKKE
jgi:hypothetical protein